MLDDNTLTLFHVDESQVLGKSSLPKNTHIKFKTEVDIMKDKNTTKLVFFDEPGMLETSQADLTTSIFLKLDPSTKNVKYIYYTWQELIFELIIALPIVIAIFVGLLSCLNMFQFYGHISRLIQRRYSDAKEWNKVQDYLKKFKKIHSALEGFDQF